MNALLGVPRLVGRVLLAALAHAGRLSLMVLEMIRGLAEWRIWLPRTVAESANIGVGSLFIVLLISGFAGAVTAFQSGYQWQTSLPLYVLGTLIVSTIVLELGPVLIGLVLAGRIGARYAAELGTMRVTEQIDALESLGRSPGGRRMVEREGGAAGDRRGLHLRGAVLLPSLRRLLLGDQGVLLRGGHHPDPLLRGLQHQAGRRRGGPRHHGRRGRQLGRDPAAQHPPRQDSAQRMIELRGVAKRFGEQVVLDGVDFDVQEGETLALLGPSGTGKSVLLKHVNGLIRPDAGSVVVDGLDVVRLSRHDLTALRTRIGYVFQNGALFDSMTVFENVRLGLSDEARFNDLAYARERVAECLRLVNLAPDTARKFPAELSGGMRKRVGIARAIAGEPKYLLYDEPTSGLDPVNADIIDELVKQLDNELGVTSVMVTHDVRGAFRVADRLALLSDGKIVLQGSQQEFLESRHPKVREFLERDFDNRPMVA
jgi:phospholipid/cholesterol/gamma-HCH transport system ATP-binding protein